MLAEFILVLCSTCPMKGTTRNVKVKLYVNSASTINASEQIKTPLILMDNILFLVKL